MQPSLQWKSNKYYILWVCVCCLRYAEFSAHAPYCRLWPAPLYNNFPHCLVNCTIFERNLLNVKCVFRFSLQLLSAPFFILEEMSEISSKVYIILHIKYPLFFSVFNETWGFSTDFRRNSNIKFHKNPSSGSRVVPWGLTDRQTHARTDMMKLIVAFRSFAKRA